MNFEFFAFLIFMSFVSFAVAFLAYAMVVRRLGKEGFGARIGQVVIVPACIVLYDILTFASGEYKYYVGSIPLLGVAAIALYYRFFKGESFVGDKEELSPSAQAKLAEEPKKFSKKSARIHERRKNRGRE